MMVDLYPCRNSVLKLMDATIWIGWRTK